MSDRELAGAQADAIGGDALRNQLFAWLDTHRRYCQRSDCTEPANLLAWLAHCAGVTPDKRQALLQALDQYDTHCPTRGQHRHP